MKQKKRRLLIPVIGLLYVMGLGLLGQFKEEFLFDVTPPDSPPTAQAALGDRDFTWEQPGDVYYLQIANTGEESVDVHVKSGFPWPKHILVINPGDTWTLAVENAHHRTHTITFETEEGTPSGTVQVWSIQ